jgi:hypothetical protein
MAADLIMTTRSRRWFLRLGAAWSAALVACRSKTTPPAAEPHALGAAVSPYGSRSRFEKAARHVNTNTKVPLEEASSGTPLHDTYGIITPSSLHINRAMPFDHPSTMTPDEVYATTAYVLFLNGIVGEHDVLNETTLPQITMPNRDGFTSDPRPDVGASPKKRSHHQ